MYCSWQYWIPKQANFHNLLTGHTPPKSQFYVFAGIVQEGKLHYTI